MPCGGKLKQCGRGSACSRPSRLGIRSDFRGELQFDELALVVLDEDYLLREFYLAPVKEVEQLMTVAGSQRSIRWNNL